jgi:threonine synthase
MCLSRADWLCLPVGNAGNITPIGRGSNNTTRLKSMGLPQVLGVQAAGSAPLVLGHPVENPETVATAIRIGKPARGEQALQAAEESGGASSPPRTSKSWTCKRCWQHWRDLGGTGLRRRAGRAGA